MKINPNDGPEWALRCKNDNIDKWKNEMIKDYKILFDDIKFNVKLNF